MPTEIEKAVTELQEQAAKELAFLKATHPNKHKTPSTIQEGGMNQYEATQKLRVTIRQMELPPTNHLTVGMNQLRDVLGMPRSTKAARLAAFTYLEESLNNYLSVTNDNVQRLRHYVQHIPTAPNLPQTNSENVVRAIAAILKTNGMVSGD